MSGHDSESKRNLIVHDHWGGPASNPGSIGGGGPHPQPNATGAIRVGDWKLMSGVQNFATWFGDFSPNTTGPSNASNTQACATVPCLFNIKNDTTEHHDLAAEMPGKVAELMKIFNSYSKKIHAGGPKGSDEDGYCAAAAENHGFMVPWRTQPVVGTETSDAAAAHGEVDPLLNLDIESAEFASFVSGGYNADLQSNLRYSTPK